ncbi:MAG: TOBE domain-containing protein [Nitrospirales bacterium]
MSWKPLSWILGPIESEHSFIGCPLSATIPRKSLAALKLHPGQAVHAQIKAVALTDDSLE